MLHTEPPYSNYGTKIFGVQTGRIETRHLFSVDGQREYYQINSIGVGRLTLHTAYFQI